MTDFRHVAVSGMALATGPLIWPAASAVPLTKHRCLLAKLVSLDGLIL